MLFKNRIVIDIQGKYFSVIYIIASLPVNTPLIRQYAYKLLDNDFLFSQVGRNILLAFIRFTNVVRRGGYDKGDSTVRDSFQKGTRITLMKCNNIAVVIII